ncbi:UvrD-helicase domain-containing protein [Undibacterium sp. Ji50W]|uniref:UvrD-helicase domain-containing protein n=1 Tax=Undibacterium sp. Ji50W TaxID=3413041 RepID=UPI003BF1EDD6
MTSINKSPAELASEQAIAAVYDCLTSGKSFLLEAGAGAGKTYSLVKALRFLCSRDEFKLPRNHQRIACITFTNVAKDEIVTRTDRDPLIHCDTTHAFCWSLISGFQKQLRSILPTLKQWSEKFEEVGPIQNRTVEYSLGFRSIKDDRVFIHHDDVLPLTIALMENEKFRRIFADKYPVVLIDEYQDTDADWVEAVKTKFLGQTQSPQFGFFGDFWQKIYGDGCGRIDHPAIVRIGKEANFRSVPAIVNCLNRMRPELKQMVEKPEDVGSVKVFHTNKWMGERQSSNHWKGDLPTEVSHTVLESVCNQLKGDGWNLSATTTKILMLTHRVLATEQGYASLPGIFEYNESFAKKENDYIAYFVVMLEPACVAYSERKFGKMFEALGGKIPGIQTKADKIAWASSMDELLKLRAQGAVGNVIDHLRKIRRPRLPESLEQQHKDLDEFDKTKGEEMPRRLSELDALRAVPYAEIVSLSDYLTGHSPFETKHGVKGAQFENVLVVVGRGWNQYNFNEMLELAQDSQHVPAKRQAAYERNRNLFYVACSRPKRRLALIFTQELSAAALKTLEMWFGTETVEAIAFPP